MIEKCQRTRLCSSQHGFSSPNGSLILAFAIAQPAATARAQEPSPPAGESTTTTQVQVDPTTSPSTPNLIALELDTPIEADLSTRSPRTQDGAYFHQYRMIVPAGSAWQVSATSQELDPMVIVTNADGRIVSANDDRVIGKTTDAQARGYTLDGASYNVEIRGLSAGDLGRYQLQLEYADLEVLDPLNLLTPDEDGADEPSLTIRGALSVDDPTLPDASHYDPYFVQLPAGRQVQIALQSDRFDGYLVLLAEDGRPIADADDDPESERSGERTNPTLTVPPVDAGVYQLLVSSFYAGETGDYKLVLSIQTP